MNDRLSDEVAKRVRRGEQPDSIEAELLSSRPGLGEDEIAAAWLYAFLAREQPLSARLEHRDPASQLELIHD
jgi:hypothetical protein